MKTLYRLYLNSRRDLEIACCHVSCGRVNSCASTTTLLMEESNFLENVEKQMRKSRVKNPVVSKSRGYLGNGGGQLTCAMQDMLCSTILHLFLYQAHFFNPPPSLVPRSRSVLRRGRSGYKISYPLLTLAIIYEHLLFCHN